MEGRREGRGYDFCKKRYSPLCVNRSNWKTRFAKHQSYLSIDALRIHVFLSCSSTLNLHTMILHLYVRLRGPVFLLVFATSTSTIKSCRENMKIAFFQCSTEGLFNALDRGSECSFCVFFSNCTDCDTGVSLLKTNNTRQQMKKHGVQNPVRCILWTTCVSPSHS